MKSEFKTHHTLFSWVTLKSLWDFNVYLSKKSLAIKMALLEWNITLSLKAINKLSKTYQRFSDFEWSFVTKNALTIYITRA